MNYVRNYYKNLCEKYEYQIHNLQKHIQEVTQPYINVHYFDSPDTVPPTATDRPKYDEAREEIDELLEILKYPGWGWGPNTWPKPDYTPGNGTNPDPSKYFPKGLGEGNPPKREDFPPGPMGDALYKEVLKLYNEAMKRLNADRAKQAYYNSAQQRKLKEAKNAWDRYYEKLWRIEEDKKRGRTPPQPPKEPKAPKPPGYQIPEQYRIGQGGIAENWQIKKCKCKKLNEVASPFQVDSPLSSGGAADDPNTKNISSAEQISAEEESPLAYYEPYYMDVLNWWRSQPNWRDDPLWERTWEWMAINWHRNRIENPGGVPPYYTHKDIEWLRDVLAWWFTSTVCTGNDGCQKGVTYPEDWPVQPPWSPPGQPPN